MPAKAVTGEGKYDRMQETRQRGCKKLLCLVYRAKLMILCKLKVVKLSHPNYEYNVHYLVKAYYAED